MVLEAHACCTYVLSINDPLSTQHTLLLFRMWERRGMRVTVFATALCCSLLSPSALSFVPSVPAAMSVRNPM